MEPVLPRSSSCPLLLSIRSGSPGTVGTGKVAGDPETRQEVVTVLGATLSAGEIFLSVVRS